MSAIDFIAVGSVIIDDIVYPDGRTDMGVLGGGGAHAACGMALAGERPGLAALVGKDLPTDIRARLARDFDTSGLVWSAHKQLRGWQIFEWDGRRNEVFRVDVVEPFQFEPLADSPDMPFTAAKGITLLRGPSYVQAWRRRFPQAVLLWEPLRAVMMAGDYQGFLEGIPHADIVSPNLLEAQTVYGIEDELEILRRMLADGVRVAALRMGERGSLLAAQGQSQAWHIPPLSVDAIVDQTGAGNAYCGGFIVGWVRRQNLIQAGCYAAAAASFTLETVGIADIPPQREIEWHKRLQDAREGVKTLAL